MPIQSEEKKEIPKVHKDIEEVGRRAIEKKKERLEKRKTKEQDKEIIKESIKEKTEKEQESKIASPAELTTAPKKVVRRATQLKGEEKERQIKLLTDLAFEKGVIHATEVASKLDDPYILDEFHDTLVDELYKYLVEQDKLKQI